MSDENSCGCHGDTERAERDPAYRRALWLVVLLNVGFGLIEIVGGFIAGSQALKADALDFLGDGSITFVGLLALAWSERSARGLRWCRACSWPGSGSSSSGWRRGGR